MKTESSRRRLCLAAAVSALVLIPLTACAAGPAQSMTTTQKVAKDCAPAHEFPTLTKGVLTIVAGESAVNFHGETPQGPYHGIGYDLVSGFAAKNCLALDVTLGTAGGSQLALQEGQADLMATFALATPERRKVFNLTDRILFEGMGIISADGSVSTVEDLKGKQVGVQAGANWGAQLREIYGSNIIEYSDLASLGADVKVGRLSAAAVSSQAGLTLTDGLKMRLVKADDTHPDLTRTYDFVWASTKGNNGLTEALNDYLSRAREDGSLNAALADNGVPKDFIDFYLNGR
ncbi:MAG: transporter substrate-binding domain-containing protein [Actinobacteria bacterium]|nr:transporter substrate-binding domain-containing protein [Actinomycetota bacterium]